MGAKGGKGRVMGRKRLRDQKKKRQRGVRSPRSALGSPLAWPRSAGTRHCRREEFASVSLGGAREVRRAAPRPQQSKRERRPRGNPRAPPRRGARGRRRSDTRGPARAAVGAVGRREETRGAAPRRGGREVGPGPRAGAARRASAVRLRARAALSSPGEAGGPASSRGDGRCRASGREAQR